MSIEGFDSNEWEGFTRIDAVRMTLAWWAFRSWSVTCNVLRWLRLPHPWPHESRVWLWLASECYLLDEYRQGLYRKGRRQTWPTTPESRKEG
jgi:hypothetical protein